MKAKAIFNKEPVVWLGLLASLLVALYEQATGPGVIVDGNAGQTIANLITVFAPTIAAFIQRNFVTPVN